MTDAEAAVAGAWRVVLADDDDDQALLIRTALERAARGPIRIERARDGEEAIRLVERAAPDLLLLDLHMPGRSGHDVLERIKGDDALRAVPVAILTSSDRDEDVARSYGLGSNHFITKPGDPAELERRLVTLLANLSELRRIRRGTGEIRASGMSALGPGSFALTRVLPWIMFTLLVVVLVVYARLTGLF